MQTLNLMPPADRPYSPADLLDDSYREIVRGEFDQGRRAWLRILADMQQANARWVARRQDMIRENARVWLDPRALQPDGVAAAWRHWASRSAQRWIDDVADQVEIGVKAAMCMSETTPTPTPAVTEPAPAKPKRAKSRRKANGQGDRVHH